MVKLQLSIKAELENVTDLVPATDDFEFFFKVKCTSCNELHPKDVSLNRVEEREMSSGKGSIAHFVWRCSNCKRESSAKFEPTPPRPYTAEDSGKFAPLISLDCRGLEFTDFDPRGPWTCKGTDSGTVFQDIELSELEWTEYDDKTRQPVGIMELESRWTRA